MPINWNALGAGALGTVDELLFGLPEYIAKKVDRKKVQAWIDKNKTAYNIGEGIGTVGSAFIPYAGLAGKALKGAGLAGKVIKAADVGTDLIKAGDTALDFAKLGTTAAKAIPAAAESAQTVGKLATNLSKYGKLAGKGAIAGAAEAGVRGITSEKTPQEIMNDIQTGGLFGAAGGAAGGALGSIGKRLSSEAKKNAELAFLGTTDIKGRQALGFLRDIAGTNAKGIGKFKAADRAREELVRVGKEIGAHIPGKMDDAILSHAAKWDKLDKIVETMAPNARGSEWYMEATKTLDLPKLYKEFGQANVDGLLSKVMKQGAGRSGLANIRSFLSDLLTDAYKQSGFSQGKDAAFQRMQMQIANGLRSGVDDTVTKLAEKSGVNIDFKKLKKDYLPMRALADSAARADVTPMRVNMGSPTAEKLALQEVFIAAAPVVGSTGLGATLGYNTAEGDRTDKLMGAGIGALGGALGSRMIGGLTTRGIAASLPIAKAIDTIVQKAAPEALEKFGAQAGGQLASQAARQIVKPETKQEAQAVDMAAAAGSGNREQYMGLVFGKLKEYSAAQGVAEDSQEFADFLNQVAQLSNGFDPKALGGLFYTNPAERAAYNRALDVSTGLRANIGQATSKKPGYFGKEAPEAELSRNAALDQIASLVGSVAKERGSEAAAKKGLMKIMSGSEPEERKLELVKVLLENYGVDFDTIERLGL